MQNHPSSPSDPLVGGGASAVYMNNINRRKDGGQSNILSNQENAASTVNGVALIVSQGIDGGLCAQQP